jgi:hypothetical protein
MALPHLADGFVDEVHVLGVSSHRLNTVVATAASHLCEDCLTAGAGVALRLCLATDDNTTRAFS